MDKGKKTILVVEDDQNIADLIKLYCEQDGFRMVHVVDGAKGVEFVQTVNPDCVILDWMLPTMNGIEVLKKIRQFSEVPILMVTAKAEELDKILGLEFGADDYITKPFSPKELMARVRAILRRVNMGKEGGFESLKVLDLEIDANKMMVKQGGDILNLSVLEFKLLSILAASPGQVFSREKLMQKIYDSAAMVFDRTIDVHVKNLRKKLGDTPKEPRYIESVFGIGYKFKEYEN